MRIAIGSDENACELKAFLLKGFEENTRFTFVDCGIHAGEIVDYPDIAVRVAERITSGECARGVLLCGTGIGMAISANKIPGIYAAVCHDLYSTQRSVLSNNCNVFCLGALVVGRQTARVLLDIWLDLHFIEGASSRKIEKVRQIENQLGSVPANDRVESQGKPTRGRGA